MRAFISSTVFLVFAALFHPFAIAGPSESSVWIDIERSSGVMFRGYRLPREGEGMGVIISPHEIVTAAHVVFEAKKISVKDVHGTSVSAEIVDIDEDVDLAILRSKAILKEPTTIGLRKVAIGEDVSAVSRLWSQDGAAELSATVTTTNYISNSVAVPLIFSGIKGERGMSGGGLFDVNGQLVGVIVRIDALLGYLSAVPIGELCVRFARCEVDGGW